MGTLCGSDEVAFAAEYFDDIQDVKVPQGHALISPSTSSTRRQALRAGTSSKTGRNRLLESSTRSRCRQTITAKGASDGDDRVDRWTRCAEHRRRPRLQRQRRRRSQHKKARHGGGFGQRRKMMTIAGKKPAKEAGEEVCFQTQREVGYGILQVGSRSSLRHAGCARYSGRPLARPLGSLCFASRTAQMIAWQRSGRCGEKGISEKMKTYRPRLLLGSSIGRGRSLDESGYWTLGRRQQSLAIRAPAKERHDGPSQRPWQRRRHSTSAGWNDRPFSEHAECPPIRRRRTTSVPAVESLQRSVLSAPSTRLRSGRRSRLRTRQSRRS